MDRVRVIAPMGAELRGPATLQLTPEQHAPRAHVLGKPSRKGIYRLDGGESVTFKAGEEFRLQQAEGRVNTALFELVDGVAEAADAAAPAAGNPPAGAAP